MNPSTNHAKIYGLHPRKGTIAIGADADIAIWDPNRTARIHHADMHDGADYTPYEGMDITGWPVATIVRGEVIVDNGKLAGRKTHGQHVARGRSDYAKPGIANSSRSTETL